MRTTIDLPDALWDHAKTVAAAADSTVRELVIEGLREVVARREAIAQVAYHLPERAVGGRGLQPGVSDLRWESLRELVHDEAGR